MKAAALLEYGRPLELIQLPDPHILSPADVIIRVAGAGVCGSDLHVARGRRVGPINVPTFPYVIGHENAGWVMEVGSAVEAVAPGDAVLLHPKTSCGLCRACRRGLETHCLKATFPGVDGMNHGGYAEFMSTDIRSVVRLPDGTDPRVMAPLSDAGLSAYHAVRRASRQLPPDGTAVVIGVGGLGHFVVQLLSAFSPARIVAVDVVPERLRAAEALGVDAALLSDGQLEGRILEMTKGEGAEVVIDCVATGQTPQQALALVAKAGMYLVLGAEDGEIRCPAVAATGRELTIEGSLIGSTGELAELIDLTVRGRVTLKQTYYPLSEAAAALDDLRSGRVDGRPVLVPAVPE